MIKKVVLSFPVDATDRSLTYDLVKLYDIRINILKAEIQAGKSGNLLVELEADTDKLDQGIAYLIENGVTVSPVSSKYRMTRASVSIVATVYRPAFPTR